MEPTVDELWQQFAYQQAAVIQCTCPKQRKFELKQLKQLKKLIEKVDK